jgi:hypothetical protein
MSGEELFFPELSRECAEEKFVGTVSVHKTLGTEDSRNLATGILPGGKVSRQRKRTMQQNVNLPKSPAPTHYEW